MFSVLFAEVTAPYLAHFSQTHKSSLLLKRVCVPTDCKVARLSGPALASWPALF